MYRSIFLNVSFGGKKQNMMDVNSSPVSQREDFSQASISARVADYTKMKKHKEIAEDDDRDLEFWSAAKRQAYESIETNPNAFYYRHVAPGQKKKTGPWDDDEKELFLKAMKMHPPSQGRWGLFAQYIPGRVGYQCRNFYHRLLKSGELEELPDTPVKIPKEKQPRPMKRKREVVKYHESESDSPFEMKEERDSELVPDIAIPVIENPIQVEKKYPVVVSEPFVVERIALEEDAPVQRKHLYPSFDQFIVDDYDPTLSDNSPTLQKITMFPKFGPL